MATKPELEAELAELRAEIKKMQAENESNAARENETIEENISPTTEDTNTDAESAPFDWDKEISSLIKDVKNSPGKQAILVGLGMFALGFIAGKSR
ncbi:hypothetical protein [Kordiimonas sp. SCSIO 12610]|uniref:hypothetical protein n=1 Tax=Kordiimonas sp. SCSIO 12610 TaxID=2829597 RepID=UPI00210C3198|nr:hypothetical protein [Kordiimonas sp. SCSIO 12610]UTW56497.1 hypothetical protein KFF44_06240 [Kordiimonas sp. SCSIO 12610]